MAEQLAQLALVELAEALEQGDGLRRGGDHDLAAIVRVVGRPSSPSSTRRSASPLADDEPTPSRAASSDMRSSPAASTTYRTLAWAMVTPTSVNSGAWAPISRCISAS